MPKPKEISLMEETERLVKRMVRESRRRKVSTNKKGEKVYHPADPVEQKRAVESAMRLMALQAKIDPPTVQETEFDREQRAYHGAGNRSATAQSDDEIDGRATTTH